MGSIARAETVGSLLRSPRLLAAREGLAAGTTSPEVLRALEDGEVIEAIALQERCRLDVLTDGELRRSTWAQMPDVLDCFEPRAGGPGLTWHAPDGSVRGGVSPAFPTVVRPIGPTRKKRLDEEEYGFLKAHTSGRTKYSLPAPSYHRRYWNDAYSLEAYPSCEAFLEDLRDVLRELVEQVVALGCDYVQLDAPNYGSLCDPDTRARLEASGRDLDEDLRFDAALDSSLVAGLEGVTTAIHVCRGNGPGGMWHSSGGYGVLSKDLFPRLGMDTFLLEYDTDRAGDFGPLRDVPEGVNVVLGLLTTKSPELETEEEIERRIREAAELKPLDELALSTQCGFASVAAGNPLTPADEEAKLRRVGEVAHRIWEA